MQSRKSGKRGRPPNRKADDSQNESSESYSHKALKKKPTKKNIQSKKKDETLVMRKSKSKVDLSSVDSFSDSEQGSKKTYKVPVQIFNSNQVYNDILNKANRQPQFLIMLKNLLSGCARLREDKKSQYRKKWKMLRNSNCTQDQYLNRQNQLKKAQAEEIGDIEQDIISKLSLANIRGFQTRQSIVNNYKLTHTNIDQSIQYIIDENQWNRYRQQQKKLLQILMNENDFVSQDYKLINITTKYVPPESQPTSQMNKQQENQMETKFNNLQTEENQENIQFLFCKNYNNINYDKVFDCSNPFKISQDEKYMIDAKAMSWLLESKCDQIYINQQFQKQTYEHYTKILKQMYKSPDQFSDSEVMNNILQTGAYILNSVHYYQKFKLKCDLLHPLDLLLVIESLNKQRNKKINGDEHMDEEEQKNFNGNSFINDENIQKRNEMVDQKEEEF